MRRIARSRATVALPVLALLPLGLLCPGCAGGERRQQEQGVREEHAEDEEGERGAHGGRLLRDDDFGLEVVIFERGVPPEFRLYPLRDGKPVDPKAVTASIALARLGGRTDTIAFTPAGDYLRGDRVVQEPHSFDVTVEATVDGATHTWAYEQIEGRVEIGSEALATSGIEVATAGPATIRTTLTLPGQIAPNHERVAQVLARLSGMLTEAPRTLGDHVRAGDVMAAIDSRDLAEAKNEYIESSIGWSSPRPPSCARSGCGGGASRPRATCCSPSTSWRRPRSPSRSPSRSSSRSGSPAQTLTDLAVEPAGIVVDRRVRAPFAARLLTRYEVETPIAGEVIEKHVTLGESVQADTSIFVVADLSSVWVDIAVYATDLGAGADRAAGDRTGPARAALEATGSVVLRRAARRARRRAARRRASCSPNADGRWRPGLFVTVYLVEAERAGARSR